MNILFILKNFGMGGVEVVTAVLANKFAQEGHNVSIFAFSNSECSIIDKLDRTIRTYTLRNLRCNRENVYAMMAVMLDDKVNVVINQWGLPFVPIKVARKAGKGLGIKFISVYHSIPCMNGRIQSVDMQMSMCNSSIKRSILELKRKAYMLITAKGMRYNYKYSDHFMVLSPSYVEKFKSFTGIKNPAKLLVQTNPVTIDATWYKYDSTAKLKEIIYVGRLDNVAKKTRRIIEVWRELEPLYPDWCLTIVGDGEERINMEMMVHKYNLNNISFEGFQNPSKYYERASILVLASDFEGFPLVLAECMGFGVVPIVYGSYSAVFDIIRPSENGVIVLPEGGKFVTQYFVDALRQVMDDGVKRDEMAQQAIITSNRDYSINVIYDQWMKTLRNLLIQS